MEAKTEKRGLSNKNRNLIIILIIIFLLIFGPVEPYGIIFRLAYLIIIPLLFWLALKYWGRNLWKMGALENDHLNRAIFATVAGILLVGAYSSFTEKNHLECDQQIGIGDRIECVGDYIRVDGPNKIAGLIQIVFAGVIFYFAIIKESKDS